MTTLTAWLRTPDRRGRLRHRRRGAQPPAGVRRRGRAGADHPPQQGPRVPDRLPAVPVGAGLHPHARPGRCSSTIPSAGDARTIDVALEGPEYEEHRRQNEREQRGEDLRLAYVALTRARHQAVVWWAGSWDSRNSPLGRLLFGRDEEGNIADFGSFTPSDASVRGPAADRGRPRPGLRDRRAVAAGGAGHRGIRRCPRRSAGGSPFDRGLDLRWRRTSYSDITAASHEAWVASEPEQPLLSDEPERAGRAPRRRPARPSTPRWTVPSPMAAMPFGASVGTFVHRVLEASEFDATDLDGRAVAADRGGAGATRRRHRRSRRSSPPGCARCSRPRSARCSAVSGCATSRAATGSTSSSSSFRWPAATAPPGS